jgi:two-component system, NarL family, response regulator
MDNLRVLLVEDDELFRLGLVVRLQRESEIEIVAEAIDGEMAVELTNQYLPDVVLLDVGLPGIGGVEACRQIKQLHPNIPVLVLTSHFKKQLIEQLIATGASGYCLKGIEAETLILALHSVSAGASWWDAATTAEIRSAFKSTSVKETNENNLLTTRETEILTLIAAGKSNNEIAQQLNITVGTVRVHVHAILQKLEVRDRTSAAIMAIQQNLII